MRTTNNAAPCLAAATIIATVYSGNAHAIEFENISDSAGVSSVRSETWGSSWADYNNDGYPDIFVNNHRNHASLFLNNGDGTLIDASLEADVSKGWVDTAKDTHGAAWGDYDNDGDQDLVLPHRFFFENIDGLLYERTASNGAMSSNQWGNMAAWFDHDNDGRLDFMMHLRDGRVAEQQPDQTFVNKSNVGIECGRNGFADSNQLMHLSDINNNGRMEIICGLFDGSYPGHNTVSSLESGTATNYSMAAQKPVRDVAAADFDNDGDVDIFHVKGALRVSDYVQVNAIRAEAFMNVTNDHVKSFVFAATGPVDFDIDWNEGDEGGQSNRTGNPETRMRIGSGGYQPDAVSFTLDPADPDNRGRIAFDPASDKVFVIGYDEVAGTWTIELPGAYANEVAHIAVEATGGLTALKMTGLTSNDKPILPLLLENDGTGVFSDATAAAGFDTKEMCVSVVAADLDNDQDIDLYLACRGGAQNLANVVYENQGDGTFQRVADAAGAAGPVGAAVGANFDGAGTADSVTTADFDADGFLDLFVTNGLNLRPKFYGGPHQLYRNKGNGNHWIELDLQGTTVNRDGIGAKVWVTTPDGVTQLRERHGSYHRWSQDHKRLHFGLGGNASITQLHVSWPDGSTDTWIDIAPDQVYKATQGGAVEPVVFSEPKPYKCEQPSFKSSEDHGLLIWKNCYNGSWTIRGVGGGTDTVYTGTVEVAPGLLTVTGETSIDADDSIDLDGGTLSFSFHSGRNGQDGVNFDIPASVSACLTVTSDTGAPVLVGKTKKPYLLKFDLNTMGPCRASTNVFSARFVDSDGGVSSLATADSLLANGGVAEATLALAVVDLHDGNGGAGNYGMEQPFPFGDTFAAGITGEFVVDADGYYTFGINSDDGARLRIDGNDVIVDDSNHGTRDTFGTVNLTTGTHSFELVYFENTGGASLELFVAAGSHTTFGPAFALLEPAPLPDSDGDGFSNQDDVFPEDPDEWFDSDGDGIGDNGDAFPFDGTETQDTDGDGTGDNADAFPDDPAETKDSDGDSVGDNADLWPYNPAESTDSDGDGVGDNADALPNDPTETMDSDGDGIGDNADPYPNDPNNASGLSCREPPMDRHTEAAAFLWEDCDGSGRWHLRVTGGGTNVTLTFRGVIESNGGVQPLVGYSIEASDVLDTLSNAHELRYALAVYNVGVDGFDFTAAPGSCFIPEDNGLPVYLGEGRHPLATADLNLESLDACPVPVDTDGDGLSDAEEATLGTDPAVADTDAGGVNDGNEVRFGTDPLNPADDNNQLADICGEPAINGATDRGQFVWRDCGGANDGLWHLRVSGGSTSKNITYNGVIESAGGLQNLTPVSLEASDVVDTASNPDQTAYSLRVWGSGSDGLDFRPAPDACFMPALSTDWLVYLGENKTAMTGDNLNLSTISECTGQTDTDGDGLTDADESGVYGTNPAVADTDAGGVHDGHEITNGTNPLNGTDDYSPAADADGDGLTYAEELELGTDPAKADTDGEGLPDGDEVHIYGTDPLKTNTDKDGINDRVEILWKGTDPLNPDTDGDGLTDGEEASQSGLGTNPLKADTDGGGTDDGVEVTNGTDPLNPQDD